MVLRIGHPDYLRIKLLVIHQIHVNAVIVGLVHDELIRCGKYEISHAGSLYRIDDLISLCPLRGFRSRRGNDIILRHRKAHVIVGKLGIEAFAAVDEALVGPAVLVIFRKDRVEIRYIEDIIRIAVPVCNRRDLRRKIIRKRHFLAGCERRLQPQPDNGNILVPLHVQDLGITTVRHVQDFGQSAVRYKASLRIIAGGLRIDKKA